MTFPVMLTRECFATDGTDEWALVGVCAKVGAKIICTGEALGTEITLEGCRVFLDAAGVGWTSSRTLRISQVEDVVAVRDGGG